jgi:hypothetical protein
MSTSSDSSDQEQSDIYDSESELFSDENGEFEVVNHGNERAILGALPYQFEPIPNEDDRNEVSNDSGEEDQIEAMNRLDTLDW